MFGFVFVKCFGFYFKNLSGNASGTNSDCSSESVYFDVEIRMQYIKCSSFGLCLVYMKCDWMII